MVGWARRTAIALLALFSLFLVACGPRDAEEPTVEALFTAVDSADAESSLVPQDQAPAPDPAPAPAPAPALSGKQSGGLSVVQEPPAATGITLDTGPEGFSQGPPEAMHWEVTGLERLGFTRIELEVSEEGQNARLQFPVVGDSVDPSVLSRLTWRAYGLDGREEALGRCRSDWHFTDTAGQRVPFGETGALFTPGPYELCQGSTNMIMREDGVLTVNFAIRNPGFETVHLNFDILVVS